MSLSDLPEATLRFEPKPASAFPGQVERCIVVVDGQDVAELRVTRLSYEQEGMNLGLWSVSLLADSMEPLSRTMRFGR